MQFSVLNFEYKYASIKLKSRPCHCYCSWKIMALLPAEFLTVHQIASWNWPEPETGWQRGLGSKLVEKFFTEQSKTFYQTGIDKLE